MRLLAALAAALVRPDISGDLCVSCGATVTTHFRRFVWVGCAEPQSEPEPLIRLARVLKFPSQVGEVHGGSVRQPASVNATQKDCGRA